MAELDEHLCAEVVKHCCEQVKEAERCVCAATVTAVMKPSTIFCPHEQVFTFSIRGNNGGVNPGAATSILETYQPIQSERYFIPIHGYSNDILDTSRFGTVPRSVHKIEVDKNCRPAVIRNRLRYPNVCALYPPRIADPDHPKRVIESNELNHPRLLFSAKSINTAFFSGRVECTNVVMK